MDDTLNESNYDVHENEAEFHASTMTQAELDVAGMENLIKDKTEVITRLGKIIDDVTFAVLNACEQAKGRANDASYDRRLLHQIADKSFQQLAEIERIVTQKF